MVINAALIRQRIKELGYTYQGVADRAEISIHTLKKMLSPSGYGVPGKFLRKRLALVLEIEEAKLFPSLARGEGSKAS